MGVPGDGESAGLDSRVSAASDVLNRVTSSGTAVSITPGPISSRLRYTLPAPCKNTV